MERPTDLGRLKTEEWDLLQELADRFEAAWQNADAVDLTSFLPAEGDPLRAAALQELIKSDLEIRWRRGGQAFLEEYAQRFPELGGAAALPAQLLYEEWRTRQLFGDKPALDAYRERFPEQFVALQALVRQQPLPTVSKNAPTPPSPPAQPAAPPTISSGNVVPGGDYKMLRRIGTGGFGEVWLAEAPGGFKAAIKILFRPLDHEEAQRELRSLEVIRQVSHPFLLQTHRFWAHEDRLYIAMELAEGSLRERHKECRREGLPGVPLPELLRYFREAAEAVDYLHSEQVLHRDLKPDNVLLLKGHAKVADFGLARAQLNPTVSVSGSGTPAYMAPEVWRGKAGEASDRYSLALAWAELRLGRRPFPSTDYMGVMIEHLEAAPDLGALPATEQQVLGKALAKKPGERFASCREFVQALEDALADELKKPAPAAAGGGGSAVTQRPTPDVQTERDAPSAPISPFATLAARRPTPPPTEATHTQVERGSSAPPRSPRRRFWRAGVWLFGIVLAVAAGYLVSRLLPLQPSSTTQMRNGQQEAFTLLVPDPVRLGPGEEKVVPIRIKRGDFTGLVALTFDGKPDHVTIGQAEIAADTDRAEVKVAAGARATPGTHRVTVRAAADGREQEEVLPITVMVLPPDCVKDPRAEVKFVPTDGKHYYNRILLQKHGLRIPFVLVFKEQATDPPTFYLMEDKVWNDLFGKFVAAHPELNLTEWRLGGRRNGEDLTVGEAEGRLPVFRVKAEQAHLFAAWLGGLLPTAQQWDKAAGYYQQDGRRGPFRAPPEGADPPRVAVNRVKDGPLPAGAAEAEDDVSPYGVRDLAGNGREWTRNLAGPGDRRVPFPGASREDRVILRGRLYTLSRPLYYTDLAEQQKQPQTQFYDVVSPYTGFRVVLELP